MKGKLLLIIVLTSFGFFFNSSAQIILIDSFNPSETGSLCGIGYHPDSSHVWVYGCNANTIQCYDISGNLLNSFAPPGGLANDVDIEIAPAEILFHVSIILQGQLLFINGESDAAEIYAINNYTGDVIDTVSAQFGNSHVVGGSYHPERNSFFLVQDNVPGTALENLIGEINPLTGDTVQTFQVTDYFEVSYGDVEVGANGNLFVVSSIEDSIAEFSPDGAFIQTHALPAGVSTLSGIALDCDKSEAWVTSTDGVVFHLGQFPCGTTGIKDLTDLPFYLSDAMPNPFTSGFRFSIEMKHSRHVKLSLMDISGQEVNLIYNDIISAGKRDFSVMEESLPNGVYILMAESAEFKVSKRIICIK
jgi:hypothetical protein